MEKQTLLEDISQPIFATADILLKFDIKCNIMLVIAFIKYSRNFNAMIMGGVLI